MDNFKVDFAIMPDGKYPPVHYNKASVHLIIDVIITLKLKALWVNDDHKTPHLQWSTFAGILSREIIRIAQTYAALNDLPVFGSEI